MITPGWLSPTSAWRLLQCPAAVAPVAKQAHPAGGGRNAGTIAHAALASWIETGAWTDDLDGSQLQSLFDDAASSFGLKPSDLRQGLLTRARLAEAAPELTRTFAESVAANGEMACELELRDENRQLRGVIDVLVTGEHSLVLDLKTGRGADGDVPEQVRFQLLLYSHLFRVAYGRLPHEVKVFSLIRGSQPLQVTESSVQTALSDVDRARRVSGQSATPSLSGCRFCLRRLECEAHWEAAQDVRPDALEGIVLKVRRASTGVSALALTTSHGDV